jgi:hypothetical protein
MISYMNRLLLLQQKIQEIMDNMDIPDIETLDMDTQILKLELNETIE